MLKHSLFLSLAGLLLLAGVVTNSAAVQLTDGMGNTADFPDYRTDVNGNLHLVWHDADVDNGAIFYMMFNSAGNILIDRTQVNAGGSGSANTQPAVEVDGSSRVFIVWHDMSDGEIYFMRLEPLLDDLNGDAALPGTIKTVNDKLISGAGGDNAVRPRVRIDANGDLHVVWESTGGGQVQYVKVDENGDNVNGPVSLGTSASGNDLPDVDVDSNGHVHIVFGNVAPGMGADETYYAMIDGATGTIRINTTLLSIDDGLRAGQATLSVDRFDDAVYIVFKQASMNAINGVEEIFLAKLNPSLDDQDGDAAVPAVLKLSETKIVGAGMFQWHVSSRIGTDRRIHAIYMDFDEGSCPGAAVYTITNAHITFAGKTITRTSLTTTGSATSCLPQVRMSPLRNRIVWTDSSTGTREIFSATFTRADAGSSGIGCSLNHRNATGWMPGDLWVLLGSIAALGVWRRVSGANNQVIPLQDPRLAGND